jgi:hypothetical protein
MQSDEDNVQLDEFTESAIEVEIFEKQKLSSFSEFRTGKYILVSIQYYTNCLRCNVSRHSKALFTSLSNVPLAYFEQCVEGLRRKGRKAFWSSENGNQESSDCCESCSQGYNKKRNGEQGKNDSKFCFITN